MKTEELKQILSSILSHLKANADYEIYELEEKVYDVKIKGQDLNYLIGYRGPTLQAMQDLITQILFKKTNEWNTVLIDINGYKDQRIEKLHDIAKTYIDKVRFFQKEYELPEMKSWERKQVHMLISEYDDIVSESHGEGRNRRLVIKPKARQN